MDLITEAQRCHGESRALYIEDHCSERLRCSSDVSIKPPKQRLQPPCSLEECGRLRTVFGGKHKK
ncbi:hypothetical protein J6590_021266 [Homalodisca vitripennis]|nr:hypothetical protein J6590_021266 [Homalodisca vitripennis]